MPVVVVEGESAPIVTEPGRRLVLALEEGGIDILHRCGGNARCTTCRVQILAGDAGPMTAPEAERLSRVEDVTADMRLSCQVQVNHDLDVRVIRRLRDFPDMSDPGPEPIEWPADHALPPE